MWTQLKLYGPIKIGKTLIPGEVLAKFSRLRIVTKLVSKVLPVPGEKPETSRKIIISIIVCSLC
jgi:hypothetical protein